MSAFCARRGLQVYLAEKFVKSDMSRTSFSRNKVGQRSLAVNREMLLSVDVQLR